MAKLKIKKTKKQIKQAPEKPKEENEVVLPAVRSSDEPTSRQVVKVEKLLNFYTFLKFVYKVYFC